MRRFAQALINPTDPVPGPLRAPEGGDVARRYAIYRNNVTVAWVEALAANFPVIASLVGAEFMAAMSREFARANPPQSPVLAEWGGALPGWLEGFAPVAQLPYLPDIARLEQACRGALHARDAAPADPARVGAMTTAEFDLWQPIAHPAARAMHSRFPLLSIRAQALGLPVPDTFPGGEILITRPAMTLVLTPAPAGTAAVLSALQSGAGLDNAMNDAEDPAVFACLLSAGALLDGG